MIYFILFFIIVDLQCSVNFGCKVSQFCVCVCVCVCVCMYSFSHIILQQRIYFILFYFLVFLPFEGCTHST